MLMNQKHTGTAKKAILPKRTLIGRVEPETEKSEKQMDAAGKQPLPDRAADRAGRNFRPFKRDESFELKQGNLAFGD